MGKLTKNSHVYELTKVFWECFGLPSTSPAGLRDLRSIGQNFFKAMTSKSNMFGIN